VNSLAQRLHVPASRINDLQSVYDLKVTHFGQGSTIEKQVRPRTAA
jgi:hypothetical protein